MLGFIKKWNQKRKENAKVRAGQPILATRLYSTKGNTVVLTGFQRSVFLMDLKKTKRGEIKKYTNSLTGRVALVKPRSCAYESVWYVKSTGEIVEIYE